MRANTSLRSDNPSPILKQMQRVEKLSSTDTSLTYAKALSCSPAPRSPHRAGAVREEDAEVPINDIVLRPLNPSARILSDEEFYLQRKERKQARWEFHEALRQERLAKLPAAQDIESHRISEPCNTSPLPEEVIESRITTESHTPQPHTPLLPPPLPPPTPANKATVKILAKLFSKDLFSNLFCRRGKKATVNAPVLADRGISR